MNNTSGSVGDLTEAHVDQKLIAQPWKRVPKRFAAAMAVLAQIVAGSWYFLESVGTDANLSVVFEGRHFDKQTRQQALLHLKTHGLDIQVGSKGELLAPQDQINSAHALLEKANLKPATLDELRKVDSGPLSILESPAQRSERLRLAKERELNWLIRRMDAVSEAHVSIETSSSQRRWIGNSANAQQKVRVFIEPALPDQPLPKDDVDRIENLILASVPNTSSELITVYDSKNVYRMAGKPTGETDSQAAVPNVSGLQEMETRLTDQIRQKIKLPEDSLVRVSLREVDEQPADAKKSALTTKRSESRLFLNQPVAIELPEKNMAPAITKPLKTVRARIQITTPESAHSTNGDISFKDLRLRIRDDIANLISPVLLEQVDWVSQTIAPADAELASQSATNQSGDLSLQDIESGPNEKNVVAIAKSEQQQLRAIDDSFGSGTTPWIIAGVVLALIIGGMTIWRSLNVVDPSAGYTAQMTKMNQSSAWVRDMAAAVTVPEPHFEMDQSGIHADDAAKVLSGWISDHLNDSPSSDDQG